MEALYVNWRVKLTHLCALEAVTIAQNADSANGKEDPDFLKNVNLSLAR